jgi:hypothetical protein
MNEVVGYPGMVWLDRKKLLQHGRRLLAVRECGVVIRL